MKYGIIGQHDDAPESMPNVTARLRHQWTTLVGDEVNSVQPTQIQTMMRSTERGCITNMGNQVQVWKCMLEKLRVQIVLQGEAAQAFGWKVSKQPKEKSLYNPQTMAVVIMLSPLCPRTILEQVLQVWFQDFGFAHVGIVTTSAFGTAPSPTECCTVVDLGWSATQVVPTYQDKIIPEGIRRLSLGGRHLVGLWKYYCSYRQWNLMDADLLLEDVHQSLSYVSLNLKEELKEAQRTYLSKRPFDREFVLPDFQTTHKGFVRLTPWLQKLEDEQQQEANDEKAKNKAEQDLKEEQQEIEEETKIKAKQDLKEQPTEAEENEKDAVVKEEEKDDDAEEEENGDDAPDEEDEDVDSDDETDDQKRTRLLRQKAEEDRRRRELEAERQVLTVSVERFTIPEVLFSPSDAQLGGFAGLPQVICSAINATPRIYQSALYGKIRLVGGLSKMPNLRTRLERELRSLVPTHYALSIEVAEDPIQDAWMNANAWLQKTCYTEWSVSRGEFDTKGLWHRLLDNKLGKLA